MNGEARKTGSSLRQNYLVIFAVCLAITSAPINEAKCDFEAIFNFGDSNSDTGGFYAAFPAERLPYGMTYFKKPVGRATDGRLIIDFLGNNITPLFLTKNFLSSCYEHIQ